MIHRKYYSIFDILCGKINCYPLTVRVTYSPFSLHISLFIRLCGWTLCWEDHNGQAPHFLCQRHYRIEISIASVLSQKTGRHELLRKTVQVASPHGGRVLLFQFFEDVGSGEISYFSFGSSDVAGRKQLRSTSSVGLRCWKMRLCSWSSSSSSAENQ